MPQRRNLILGGAMLPLLPACGAADRLEATARRQRRDIAAPPGERAMLMQELVRHATLAPSSHNTQCWQFRVTADAIRIVPDLARRCPVVDPDDHHLFVSLGCAAENLAQAASTQGLLPQVTFDASGVGSVLTHLEPGMPVVSPLAAAIGQRQCTRGDYDGSPLETSELQLLRQAGTGSGVQLRLLTDRKQIEQVLGSVVEANTAQLGDPAFMAELKTWLRFSRDDALATGDGLFAGTSGHPALPSWLGQRALDLLVTPRSENARLVRQLRSSAGIAVFVSEASDKLHWVETGRCYERFALQATALGIRNAFLNQPLERGGLRTQFAAWLGLGPNQRPDLLLRFGRGPLLPMSLRRPVSAVVTS
jgi:hypothetical protein